MDLTTPARVARVAEKVECARLLVRLLAEHDVTQRELAAAVGASKAVIGRWCDRDRLETPSVADVRMMPRVIAIPLLRWMADPPDADIERIHSGELPSWARGHF